MTPINSSGLMAMRSAILQQNAALQKAAASPAEATGGSGVKVGAFGDALKTAISDVNGLQAKSSAATESFERGETTDIAAVMLAREQSSVSFQATLQVRNKLLSAYKDIMSMPV